jgi:RNA exonuclease 4
MTIVKTRRNRASAAVKRLLDAEERERGAGSDATPHPGVHIASFKEQLKKSLNKLRAQIKDCSEEQLSEASTEPATCDLDRSLSCDEMNLSSADMPSSPLEEICESAWDAVMSKTMMLDNCSIKSPADSDVSMSLVKPRRKNTPPLSGCVAIDCEMVGVGRNKSRSILARVAVVDEHGACLLDSYVRPTERVTDYRTRWSGIRARDLVGAPNFENVRQRVVQLIRGKILVGHAIHNDLNVLNITQPTALIRDTAFYPGLRRALAAVADKYDASQCPSLKNLCKHVLKLSIQSGEHCPVEDAASTMKLYVRYRSEWEANLLFN